MGGNFECKASFAIATCRLFVISGRIIEGSIKAGMFVTLSEPGCGVSYARIVCVESIHLDESIVSLAMEYTDDRECRMLVGLNLVGQTIRIHRALPECNT